MEKATVPTVLPIFSLNGRLEDAFSLFCLLAKKSVLGDHDGIRDQRRPPLSTLLPQRF